MNKIRRNFNGTDGYMLETSGALHILFTDNMADFTNMDSTLDALFGTTWAAKIMAASSVAQASTINDILGQKTEIVLATIEECKAKYGEVKFFSNKAFPKSDFHQKEFGTQDYDKARRTQTGLILLMDKMKQACIKYSVELLAVGMGQPQIDEVGALHLALKTANDEQESYAREKNKLTRQRILTLNECYASTRLVIDAAMVVYRDNYESRRMFVYDPAGSSNTDTGSNGTTETISRTIMDGMPEMLIEVPYDAARQYVLTNNGPAEVRFYIADSIGGNTIDMMLLPGDVMTVTSTDLGDDGNKLFAEVIPGPDVEADIMVVVSL